jgi:hypothetical protein
MPYPLKNILGGTDSTKFNPLTMASDTYISFLKMVNCLLKIL